MTVHRSKNKISNKSTGGNIKAGLVSSIGKSKMMRDKSNMKSVVNLKNDHLMFNPPTSKPNSNFLYYSNVKSSVANIDKSLQNSKTIFTEQFANKYFAAFVITSPNKNVSVFLYNKPHSPYNFFSCTVSIDEETSEFLKQELQPGKTIKLDFSNPSFKNTSCFSSISIDYYIKTRIPYSQINKLPISEQMKIEATTKLFTGYSPTEVWYKDKIDKNNVLCNFLPTEGAGVYEYVLNINEKFTLPDGYTLSLFTHKIVQ